jgi:hypothetical protein
LSESFDFSKAAQRTVFNRLFGLRLANGQTQQGFRKLEGVLEVQALLPAPDFVIARKKHYWQVQERIFDYRGSTVKRIKYKARQGNKTRRFKLNSPRVLSGLVPIYCCLRSTNSNA